MSGGEPLGSLGRFGAAAGAYQQPPREPDDHEYVGIRIVDGKLMVLLGPLGDGAPTQTLLLSERNAWTLMGLIALFVGAYLPEYLKKGIQCQ